MLRSRREVRGSIWGYRFACHYTIQRSGARHFVSPALQLLSGALAPAKEPIEYFLDVQMCPQLYARMASGCPGFGDIFPDRSDGSQRLLVAYAREEASSAFSITVGATADPTAPRPRAYSKSASAIRLLPSR